MMTAAGLLVLSGCGGGGDDASSSRPAESASKIKVGFSQIGAESDWRVAETASIKAEASSRGVDLRFSDAQGKKENQIRALRNFITQGVDAVILAPVDSTGWDPVLEEVKDAGIPVILVDRGIETTDDSLYNTLIASDFTEEGRMAGRWLAEKTGGDAKIIQLEGSPGADPAIERKNGFEEVVDQHDGMQIIASQTGDFNQEKGQEVMEALMQQYGDQVTAVYAHNDNMALGAIQAIKDAGRKPGEEILVISIDAVRSAFEAMQAGELNCTVECNPLLGPMAFDAVERILAGEEIEKQTVVQDQLFDREGITEEIVASRQY